jgi:hypothetical protein
VVDEATLVTLRGIWPSAAPATPLGAAPPWENAQPVFMTNAGGSGITVAGMMAELLIREVDLSLEEAIIRTMPLLKALTDTAAPADVDPTRELCMARSTGSYPIPLPDATDANPRPSAATQPPTLPPPNP